jgi:hypothetical protein
MIIEVTQNENRNREHQSIHHAFIGGIFKVFCSVLSKHSSSLCSASHTFSDIIFSRFLIPIYDKGFHFAHLHDFHPIWGNL